MSFGRRDSGLATTHSIVVAVVGIDGCGKSSTVRGALEQLASEMTVAAIGDVVTTGGPGAELRDRTDIPLSRSARTVGAVAKGLRRPDLYKNLKLLEFSERTHILKHLESHDPPAVILGDGDPLVNVSSWAVARYLRSELADDAERTSDLVQYISGTRRIPARELPYYIRHAWQLAVANRLHLTQFPVPDLVILLEIPPVISLERIRARGRPLQAHENEAFLTDLAVAYDDVCKLLANRMGVEVIRLPVDELGPEETVSGVVDAVRSTTARRIHRTPAGPIGRDTIEVIATTMSGSFADQRKVRHIESAFHQVTDRPVRLHIADTHGEARDLAQKIVTAGGQTVVSAGGAGTMNAVLEGCHVDGVLPPDLRLAFMRKGSADLVGKALHVPDDLWDAATAISVAVATDRNVPADVLTVKTKEPDGETQIMRMLGFGGIGVFGDVPRFTESRFVKYYKGLLGTMFGDLGPFYAGLLLATLTWSVRCALHRVPLLELELAGAPLPATRWQSIILLNADLGKDFPLGRDLQFGSGTFRVVVLRHRGLRSMLRQLNGSRRGSLLDDPARHDATVREVTSLEVRPIGATKPFMVNVDGLRLITSGAVTVGISDQILLVDAQLHERDAVPQPVRQAG